MERRFGGGAPLPAGEMNVPPPIGDDAWAECLRDLKRTLEGGSIFVVGRQRRASVDDPAKESGDVTHAACEEAFQELSRRVCFELVAQAKGLPPDHTAQGACPTGGCVRPAGHEGPCIDGQLQELRSALEESGLDRGVLQCAVKRLAAYISVAPGMQAIMKHSLPPSLWQPTFAICVGSGQVRVLTLSFVGEPVSGDRPSCKCTPYVLRLLSGNLLTAPDAPVAAACYCVRPAIRGVTTITSHLAALEPELFEAADTGDWATISEPAAGASTASSRCPSVTPSTPAPARPGTSVTPKARAAFRETSVHVGDRAARMRASLERAQSRPAPGRQDRSEPTPGARPRANTATTPLYGFGQSPVSDRTPSVSVLADGLSVKTVAGALNNVAATTGKIGSLFRRARSPAWLRPRGERPAAQPQPPPAAQPAAAQPRGAGGPEGPARPLLGQRAPAPEGAAVKPSVSPKMGSSLRPATPMQASTNPSPSAVAPAPVAAVAAAPAPARHVVDRAARMRERINRAQSTASKRHLLEPKVAQSVAAGA